jgi:hypothetical protein
MRRAQVFTLAFGLASLVAAWPVHGWAQDDVSDTTEEVGFDTGSDEEEEDALAEYGKKVGNRYLMGVNSLVTAPADPVMSTVKPAEEFNQLPGAVATKYPVGFFAGTMLSVYRFGMGAMDILFAPLTPMKMLSPEPRYMIFPDVTHEEY